ncbi:transposase, partial [Escherichia coli]|nr:transposase [Escherichia coli]
EKRVFLVILFTSFSGSLVSRISGAVHSLVADSTREKNRLEKSVFTDSPDAVRASIENMLQELRNEIEHLDLLTQEHIETNPELNQDFRLLTSIKSVGYLLGLNMLAILKSHSFESAEQAAAFLGVIPVPSIAFCRLSGNTVPRMATCKLR